MLVTLTEILALAEEKKCAVGAFNTPNLECITAVLRAAKKLNVPVILSHAEIHEPVAPLDVIGPVMLHFARAAKVPVCVHLDHCEDLDYMKRALELGFTSLGFSEHADTEIPVDWNAYIAEIDRLKAACGDSLPVWSGSDDITVPILSVGGCGVISVVSNAEPDAVRMMCEAFETGDVRTASEIQLRLLPLIHSLFSKVNPIPIKKLLAERGLIEYVLRPPLYPE